MKIFKILSISFLSIFVIFYLAFLFILPYQIDLNQYSPQISKAIQDSTGFQVELSGMKVKTVWDLSAGALIEKADLKYSTGEKFAQINNLEVRLSLWSMIFGGLKIDRLDADKVFANLDIDKWEKMKKGKVKINGSSLYVSSNMPDICAKKYRISIIEGKNNYTLKGNNLKISDFVTNKKIKVKTTGDLILNGNKQISYNLSIFLKSFFNGGKEQINYIKVLEDLHKYNVKGDVSADLKIEDAPQGNSYIDGKIDLNKMSFSLGGKAFPQSNLNLDFKGKKVKINSNIYTDIGSKTVITGVFNNGKYRAIDLRVLSDKVELKTLVFIAHTMLKTFGKKHLQGISADGHVKADFSIKSDFKKVESSGYLKVENANITKKLDNVSLSAINADIDFSKDSVRIRRAKANLNSQPIIIKGSIDKHANANILVLADNLQLKSVLLTSSSAKILKNNDIRSGLVSIKALLKGRLDKVVPKVNVIVSNVNFKNKKSKANVKINKIVINTNSDSKNEGSAQLFGLKVLPPSLANISVPKINLFFDGKDANIEKTYLYIDNIKTTLSGKISGIDSNPRLNPLLISVPNQISVPIEDYANSSILLKGNLIIKGDINSPQIQGSMSIPLIQIPSASMIVKNATIEFDKEINLNCPQVEIANSSAGFNANIKNDLTNGIVVKNVDFQASNIDLNALIPVFKILPKASSNTTFTILNGKSSIAKFKVGGLVSSNITSDVSMKKNTLHLSNLLGEAYLGKIGGNARYDFERNKVAFNIQGRGLSANMAMLGLTGRDDDIHGNLDFDGSISMICLGKYELIKSLSGGTNFIISNGKMGVLGKFEHLIYAQNIISNNVFKTTLNAIAKALTVKDTGVYKYMKGKITFSDGWANIDSIKTSGPTMSLYITGRFYLPENTANLIMLGRISGDVVRILGPIGEFSMNKAIAFIPKIGEITAFFANQFTTNPNYENTSQIPYLTPKTELPTKEFKVVIDGDAQRQSSVKSFKWLARPKVTQTQTQSQAESQTPSKQEASPQKQIPSIPDFVKNLPDLKK